MRTLSRVTMAVLLALGSAAAAANDRPLEIKKLTDHLYLLATDQGSYTTNTIASVGDDGVLLVDTQSESDAPALKEAVDAFGKGAPRFIINTHRHVEHVGGNAIFGNEPIVIAHDLVPSKLKSGSYLFNEFPRATFPDITLKESLTLYFNDDRIEITAFTGAHDDNEIIVHFTREKVVHLSSLVNGFNFPSVDSDGDVLKFAELVERAIALLPHDVMIVSGHNDIGRWSDLRPYHDMLVETTSTIRKGLSEGKDLETLQREKVLSRWAAYAGSYVSVDDWTEYLVNGLQRKGPSKPTVFEPLYRRWKDRGAAAAVAYYFELRREHPDEYTFGHATLLVIGDKLLKKGHTEAAISFLEASLKDEPQSKYGSYVNYNLARAHDTLGHEDLARRYCEKALELDPDDQAAAELLARLKAK